MPTGFQNGRLGFEVQLDNSEKKVKSFKNVKKTQSFNSFFESWAIFKIGGCFRGGNFKKKVYFELMAVK